MRIKTVRFLSLTTALTLALASPALAQSSSTKSATDLATIMKALEAQEARIAQQERLIQEQAAQLRSQQAAFQKIQQQMANQETRPKAGPHEIAPVPPVAGMKTHPAPAPVAQTKAQPATGSGATPKDAQSPTVVGTDRKPEEPEKPPEIAQVIEEGGVLLSKGKLVVTPSIEYLRSSATRVSIEGFSIIPALNIGVFDVSQISRNTITTALQGRLGVTNRFEVDAKVPFLYRDDATRARPVGVGVSSDVLQEADGYGLGDAEFGAHYQINSGKGGWPFLVGNLRVKTTTGTNQFEMPTDARGLATELPTGSGFWAIQPSVTAIYPSDPAVFFSNWGYLYNMKRDFGRYGEIDPGDSMAASFGMSISLNDYSSFSFSYAHNTVFNNEINGKTVPNSTFLQVGTLDLGYSYNLTDRINLNLNVSAGVTEDAPDSRITFRMPISFDVY